MAKKIGILGLKEKVGYALGDSASNFYWKVFEFFILTLVCLVNEVLYIQWGYIWTK